MDDQKKRGRKPGTLVRGKCEVCGDIELTSGTGKYFRCSGCKTAGRVNESMRFRYDCRGKDEAGISIANQIRVGALAHPSAMKCVDCGCQASEYEHRDYNYPLMVEPVCRRCNLLRGPAIPRDGWLQKALERHAAPYRLKRNAIRVFNLLGWPTKELSAMPAKLDATHWVKLAAATPTTEGA